MFQLIQDHLILQNKYTHLPAFQRYAFATILIVVTVIVHYLLYGFIEETHFLLIYPIVFLCTWFFGTGPGLYTLFVATFSMYFSLHQQDIPYLTTGMFFKGAIFVFNFLLVIWVINKGAKDESRLVENQKVLKEALFYRDEFLSIASHELKTPLTSLKLQSQMFKRAVKRKDSTIYGKDKIDRVIDQTDRQVSRLMRLVDDMLDISRIRTGKLSFTKEKVDLGLLVKDVVERMRPHFIDSSIPVPEFSYTNETFVFCDRMRVEQVLSNLINNALKYGMHKPVTINMNTDMNYVQISVTDEGRGIAAENQESIFNRFQRAVPASEVSGLGLGLYIGRLIAQAHSGTLKVRSTLGHGSSFTLTLPLAS